MALLDHNPNAPQTYEKMVAQRLREYPSQQFNQLLSSWKTSVEMIWKAQKPQVIIDEIGTDAAELFLLSQQTALFLESLKPGCTVSTVALVKAHTINPDGSITINPDIPPVEEQQAPVDPEA